MNWLLLTEFQAGFFQSCCKTGMKEREQAESAEEMFTMLQKNTATQVWLHQTI